MTEDILFWRTSKQKHQLLIIVYLTNQSLTPHYSLKIHCHCSVKWGCCSWRNIDRNDCCLVRIRAKRGKCQQRWTRNFSQFFMPRNIIQFFAQFNSLVGINSISSVCSASFESMSVSWVFDWTDKRTMNRSENKKCNNDWPEAKYFHLNANDSYCERL